MGKTATNLSIVLGLITVAFAGYYLYTQKTASTLVTNPNDQTMQTMLDNARVYIGYGNILKDVKLETQFFEDPRFTSLRSFTIPIKERPIGRPDPFADPVAKGDGVI